MLWFLQNKKRHIKQMQVFVVQNEGVTNQLKNSFDGLIRTEINILDFSPGKSILRNSRTYKAIG